MELVRAASLPIERLAAIAEHLVAEFGHLYPDWDIGKATAELSEDASHGIPAHLVAINDQGSFLGVASIIPDDEVSGWAESNYWLANVLVLEAYRNSGIGHALVAEALAVAKRTGAKEINLVTDSAVDWYLTQGWQVAGVGEVHGTDLIVLRHGL